MPSRINFGPLCIANYITTPLIEKEFPKDSYRPVYVYGKLAAYEFKAADGTWPTESVPKRS